MAAAATAAAVPLDRQTCTYTACYCEENVYNLLERLVKHEGREADHMFALFISNSNETVPFWMQRASRRADGLVVWDYHVIVIEVDAQAAAAVLVWDLDTWLPFPCTFRQYAQHALQADTITLDLEYQRRYRVVVAESFLRCFASDRSHMRLPDGSWSAEPPPYPCIVAKDGCTNNLHCYRDMTTDVLDGRYAAVAGNGPEASTTAAIDKQHHGTQATGSSGGDSSNSTLHQSVVYTEGVLDWAVVSGLASCRFGVVLEEEQLLNALVALPHKAAASDC